MASGNEPQLGGLPVDNSPMIQANAMVYRADRLIGLQHSRNTPLIYRGHDMLNERSRMFEQLSAQYGLTSDQFANLISVYMVEAMDSLAITAQQMISAINDLYSNNRPLFDLFSVDRQTLQREIRAGFDRLQNFEFHERVSGRPVTRAQSREWFKSMNSRRVETGSLRRSMHPNFPARHK